MIELKTISKKYDSRGIAGLNKISLHVQSNEVLTIMGPNGSGKSTLLNIIAGEILPDNGDVSVRGKAVLFKPDFQFQDLNVLKFLIQSNTQEIDDEKKLQLARDFADIFEFTFQLRQNISQLSAGQKQKIALAAILVNRPSLLLLDEPFTHLDPYTRRDILKSLFNYIRTQEISIVWVTHDLEEAFLFSDRIGLLNFGEWAQLDTAPNLIRKPHNIFVAQFLGYENFFPVTRSYQSWLTPWGEFQYESEMKNEEALLVVPSNAWKIDTKGLSAKVTRHYFKGLDKKISLILGDREVQMQLKRSNSFPELETKIQISPDFSECFVIPL
jgi:spermidine/putrescine transport system ATP-binding protein